MSSTSIPFASVLALAFTGWQENVALATGRGHQLHANNRAKIKKRFTGAIITQEASPLEEKRYHYDNPDAYEDESDYHHDRRNLVTINPQRRYSNANIAVASSARRQVGDSIATIARSASIPVTLMTRGQGTE